MEALRSIKILYKNAFFEEFSFLFNKEEIIVRKSKVFKFLLLETQEISGVFPK